MFLQAEYPDEQQDFLKLSSTPCLHFEAFAPFLFHGVLEKIAANEIKKSTTNVSQSVTFEDCHQTNKRCKAWNHGLHEMLSNDHPLVCGANESIQKSTAFLQMSQGPQRKRERGWQL